MKDQSSRKDQFSFSPTSYIFCANLYALIHKREYLERVIATRGADESGESSEIVALLAEELQAVEAQIQALGKYAEHLD